MSSQGRSVRAGVIGAGGIGHEHLRCLTALAGTEVVAVCDSSRAAAAAAAEQYGIPGVFTDAADMLERAALDVVHVTTPPSSHLPLAWLAVGRGVDVLVEKPLLAHGPRLEELLQAAAARGCRVIEDYNYLFNHQVRTMLGWRDEGRLGEVVHVDVSLALDVLTGSTALTSESGAHFALGLPAQIISDFLPHLASLVHAFVGRHRSVTTVWERRSASRLAADEMRALVTAAGGTATVSFSAHAQPDVFAVEVHGTRMRARADLYSTGIVTSSTRSLPGPLVPLANGLGAGVQEVRGAVGGLLRKLSGGPGAYEGLWGVVAELHDAIRAGRPAPFSGEDVLAVNDLVAEIEGSYPR